MTKLLVLLGFIVAFGAGWVSSGAWRLPHPGGPGERGPKDNNRGGWLAQQLELTPEQQKQLDQIWSEVGGRGRREDPSKRSELRKERDAKILSLIHPEDRAAYDKAIKDYNDKNEGIEQEWKKTFQRAVEKTREMLTQTQREKYDKMMSRQNWDGGPRDRGRASTRPATAPTTGSLATQ